MSIEISRKKLQKVHRINPWNARVIDVRQNKHGARWQAHSSYDTAAAAREAILKLDKANA